MTVNRFTPGNPCCSGYTLWWHIRATLNSIPRDVIYRANERAFRNSLQFNEPRYIACPVVEGTNNDFSSGVNRDIFSYDGFWLTYGNTTETVDKVCKRFYKINQDSFAIEWQIVLPDPTTFPTDADNFISQGSLILAVDKYRNGLGGAGVIYLQHGAGGRTLVGCFNYRTGETIQDWGLRKKQPTDGPTEYSTDTTHNLTYLRNDKIFAIDKFSSATSYVVNERWRENAYVLTNDQRYYNGSRRHGYSSRWEVGKLLLVTSGNGYKLGTTAAYHGTGAAFEDIINFTNAVTPPNFPRNWDAGSQFLNTADPRTSVGYLYPFASGADPFGLYYTLVYLPPQYRTEAEFQTLAVTWREEFWRIPEILHEWPNEAQGMVFPDGYYLQEHSQTVRYYRNKTPTNSPITLDTEISSPRWNEVVLAPDASNGLSVNALWKAAFGAGGNVLIPADNPIRTINFRGVYQNVLYWNQSNVHLMGFTSHWSTHGFNNANLGLATGPLITLPHVDWIGQGTYRFVGDMDGLDRIDTKLGGYFFNVVFSALTPDSNSYVPPSFGWTNISVVEHSPTTNINLIAKADNFSERQET